MKEVFLIEPSIEYKDTFIQMVQDYEKHGESDYFEMYKEALDDFHKFVEKLINRSKGIGIPADWTAYSTFWLVNSRREILGTIRIRKELNTEFLKNFAGHIGYDISPYPIEEMDTEN